MTSQRDGEPSGPPAFPSVDTETIGTPTTHGTPYAPPPPPPPPASEWMAQEPLVPEAAPVQTTSNNGGRTRWVLAGIATIVVVALIGGLFVFLGARPATPSLVAQYAPADAQGYIEVRYDLPGDQADNLAAFMSHFPGFADQASFQQKLDETLANVVRQSGTGLDWATDIKPWFGGQVGLSTSSFAPTLGTPPSYTFVLSVTDKAKLDEFVAAHTTDAGLEQETYNGQTIWSGNLEDLEDRISFAATDEALVVSSRLEDLKAALDTKAGTKQGLADDEFFLAQLGTMHADRLGLMYLDYGSVVASMPVGGVEMGGLGVPIPPGCMDALQSAADIRALGEIRAESDHMAFRLRSEIPTGADLPPAPTNRESGLTAVMPGSTVAYYELHDVGANIGYLVKQVLDCIPAGSDGTGFDPAQIQRLLGVPLDDYFDFLVDAGVALTLDGEEFGVGIVATVDDEALANARVTTLLTFARAAGGMGGEDGITVEEVQHGTARISVITIPAPSVFPGEPNPAEPATFSVSVANGRLYLGMDDFVTNALDQQASDSLAAQQHLQAAVSQVGAANSGVIFVDFDGIISVYESQMPQSDRSQYDTEVKPFVDPIADLVMVSRNDNGIGDGYGFLYVE